jgi:hypothetical protein
MPTRCPHRVRGTVGEPAGWRVLSMLELTLTGDNLLHARHLEYSLPYGEYIDRSVMLQVRQNPQ